MAGIANHVDGSREPITLVKEVEGKFKYYPENVRKILNPDDLKDIPVAFVSIAGDLRKGKSFFLNLMLKFLENEGWKNSKWLDDWDSSNDLGFQWKGGFEAHTLGIIAWGKPIFIKGDDGKRKIAVVLLDTEGNFGHGKSMEENVKIFALSTLFSSLQIFNVEKQIQANDMDYLQSFVAFAKTKHPEVGRGNAEENRKKPFQDLMFLVRDWPNSEYEFGNEGGKQYLDYIINERKKSQQQEEISEYLKETFTNLKCFLMPEPGENVRKSREKGKSSRGAIEKILTKKDLGNDFFTYLEKFGNTHLHPHKISSKTSGLPRNATAEELIEDMEIFAGILNKPLDIPNILELIANNNKERALKNAVETFTTDLNKGVNGLKEQPREESDDRTIKRSWDEFEKLVKDGKKEARDQLLKNTPFEMDHDDETIKKFEEQILGAEEKSKSRFVKSVVKPVAMMKAKSTFTSHLNEGIKQMEERMKVKMDEDMEELSEEKFEDLAKDGETTAWGKFMGDTRYGTDQQEAKEQFDGWILGARETAESQLSDLRTKYSKLVAIKNAVVTFTTHLNEGVNGLGKRMREEMDDRMIELSWVNFDELVEDAKRNADQQLLDNTPFGMEHDNETVTKFDEQILVAEEKSKLQFVNLVIKPVAMKKAKSGFTGHLNEGIKQMEERMKENMERDMEELSWEKFANLVNDVETAAWDQFLVDTRYGIDQQEAKEEFDRWILGARETAESQLRDLRTKYSKLVALKNAVETFTTHLNEGVNGLVERMREEMDHRMIEQSWDEFEKLIKDGEKKARDQLLDNTPFAMDHDDETIKKFGEQILGAEEKSKSQFVKLLIKPVAMMKAKSSFTSHLNEGIKEMEQRMRENMDEDMEELSDEKFENLAKDGEATAWHQFLGDTRYGKDQQEAKEQFDRWILAARKTAKSQLRNLRTKYSKLVAIKNAVETFTTHLNEGVNGMTKRMEEEMDEQMTELSWDKFKELVEDGKRNVEAQLMDNPTFGMEHVDEIITEIDEQLLGVEKEEKSRFKGLRVKYLNEILPIWFEESTNEMKKNRGYFFTIPKELEKLKDDAIVRIRRIEKHTEDRDDFNEALKGAEKELEDWTSEARKGEVGKNVKRAAAVGIPILTGAAIATGGLIFLPMFAVEAAITGTVAGVSIGGGAAAGAGIYKRFCDKYSDKPNSSKKTD